METYNNVQTNNHWTYGGNNSSKSFIIVRLQKAYLMIEIITLISVHLLVLTSKHCTAQ